MNVPAEQKSQAAIIENVLVRGDLKDLTEEQRTAHVLRVCESLGLNPATQPFAYIILNGKLVLYAKRDCTDQLRKLHGISIEVVKREVVGNLLTVHVRATDNTGRHDEDFGVVPFTSGAHEIAANMQMKAVTKAKRRVTLSICGLGFLDETEAEALDETPVSENQLADLIARADEVKADKEKFCKYLSRRYGFEVAAFADIPRVKYKDAMERLDRKAEAA